MSTIELVFTALKPNCARFNDISPYRQRLNHKVTNRVMAKHKKKKRPDQKESLCFQVGYLLLQSVTTREERQADTSEH